MTQKWVPMTTIKEQGTLSMMTLLIEFEKLETSYGMTFSDDLQGCQKNFVKFTGKHPQQNHF